VIIAAQLEYISPFASYWLAIPTALIALLGIADDLLNLKVGLRLTLQFILAGLGVFFIGIDTHLPIALQGLMVVIMVFFLVWMTNLYNFMDGINGLAALEAISVCFGMALIYWMADASEGSLYLLLIIAASTCGFLYWNFPKAKLFMGDAGSLFLGLCLGLLALENLVENNNLVAAWVIMLGVFIVDASYTLFYRIITRQAFHQAHRTHAYQKIAISLSSHTRTTLSVVAINLIWLLPLAAATATTKLHPVAAILVAYAPLLLLTIKYKAGRIEQ
jgi:Fuc2NAc and GlcNAc transferase